MSRLLRSRRGHASEREEDDHYISDSDSITTASISGSDSEEDTDNYSEDYTDSDEEITTEDESETEEDETEEEEKEEEEKDQIQPLASSQQQALVASATPGDNPDGDQPSRQKDHSIVEEEVIDYQSQYENNEKRLQEHREYRRKLVEDPSFVPYVGSFWGHDDRYREDLLTETRAEGSQPYFSRINTSNSSAVKGHQGHDKQRFDQHLDPLMYKKWDHSGYEELLRMDEEDERRKRSLIEAGKTKELANFKPYRPRYYNDHSRGSRNYRSNGPVDQRGSYRQQRPPQTQQEEWPQLSHEDQAKTDEADKEVASMPSANRAWTQSTTSNDDSWGNTFTKPEENGWGDASTKLEESNWKEASTESNPGWGNTVAKETNEEWDKPLTSSEQAGWNITDKAEISADIQLDQNSWTVSTPENQAVTDDLKSHTNWGKSDTKSTDKEDWNSNSRSGRNRKSQSNIPKEEKASSSWTTHAVPEINVPTTPSKWATRNERGKGRFSNNNNHRQSKSRREAHNKEEGAWGSEKTEQELQSAEDWNSTPAANSPVVSNAGWGDHEVVAATENGWGDETTTANTTGTNEKKDESADTSSGWGVPNTAGTDVGWNTTLPDSDKSTPKVLDDAEKTLVAQHQSKTTEPQQDAIKADTDGWGPTPVSELSQNKADSNAFWTNAKETSVDGSQNTKTRDTTAGWGDIEVPKLAKGTGADWDQKSYDQSQGWKKDVYNGHADRTDEKSDEWGAHKETTVQPPRRGRGYLSQKMETMTTVTASNTTPSSVSEEDQLGSQQQLSQEATPVMSAWGNFHNGGDEDSDVEIILEAEEEPEWLKQEQVLGMTAPGDMDPSSQSPHVSPPLSVDDSPKRHASRQHYYSQTEYSPRFDSRKPHHNANRNKPRRQFDDNWRRRKDDAHQGQVFPQQQPIPMYYPTPQQPNGANIAYVPMIPNTNYFHMGGNVQPMDSSMNAPDKFYGPLPPGFEANGMVYYGVDPSLYPPVQPFYYYVPMANNNVSTGSSVAYENSKPSPVQRAQEEDDDEGWGPSPEIGDTDTQWKPHSNRHQQDPSNHVMNYNHSPYYYYPQQPPSHF
ncbi:hypothetical protein BD560DRAFT_384622 [Blakeslea trispora]|nr:hypothetical protein BD560DRAFT_384622 [Blakeslea trispora]